jgi:predicted DsbA family dithiol-disulfide isomerase
MSTILEQSAAASATRLRLEVVSDVICPWCFIGKRRLEKALAAVPGLAVDVVWRPFELNPDMPVEGIERRAYRLAKFGSPERAQMLDARVTAAAASEGLAFRLDAIPRTPNTVKAHRLIWLAGREGVQDAVVERLFNAYFIEGQDIGDSRVLAAQGVAAGLDAAVVEDLLATDLGVEEVRSEAAAALRLGIHAVPTFVLDGRPAFEGAVAPAEIAERLRAAAA